MTGPMDFLRSWTDSGPLETAKKVLESALFRSPEPQPVSAWRMLIDPPMPYWVTIFSQACRLISLLILLPIILIGVIDFAGYAVFRTLGLHRRRVRIQRQSKAGVAVPVGRSSSRRKPRVYQNDRHRPTDRSNIPSIVKAPLLSPGTYDAETLLRQRARSLSIASAEEEAAWVASGGQQARLSTLSKDQEPSLASPTSPDSEGGSLGDDEPRDYFGRAPRVGVDGALGLADTDVESGTESGSNSPVQRFSHLKGSGGNSRRRGLSGGLNFTPVSKRTGSSTKSGVLGEDADDSVTAMQHTDSNSASVVSLGSSDSPDSSSNGDRVRARKGDDAGSANLSSSWIGVDPHDAAVPPPVDAATAAAAAGLEAPSNVWSTESS
ncbi:hypothetical protein PANT_10c00065 [Moesziomyces antarcticus T-34]|uniref:Uncharacterized protein n=1 Tax=Pseudozyma antarctica (strain T-34) TaxID=1151754 RepID=M9M286_PSEA3|nr:hypothetical protein PANT_10c00065 [Moesziomyces antarcticus T-34]